MTDSSTPPVGDTARSSSAGGLQIAVMSPKGGVGRTAVAVNLAMVLNEWAEPNRVVVVDADLQFGDVSLALQLDPQAGFTEAARLEAPDVRSLGSLLTRHESGLWVLPAPVDPVAAEDIDVGAVIGVLRLLRRMFGYVIVDSGAFLGEPLLTIMEDADYVLLVVDADLQTIKNAKLALDAMRLFDFPMERVRLVLNRADTKSKLDVDELQRPLGIPVAARVPYDPAVLVGVNRGEPIATAKPKSKVAEGFRTVAELVARPVDIPRARRS